jgi:hypothetical protein
MHRTLMIGLIAAALVIPVVIAKPTEDTVDIELRLTGVATQTDGGPNSAFTAYINATGEGTRKTPNGNGVQIRADNLPASVIIVDADGDEVVNFTATLGFHAQQASALAQGLPAGNFKFNSGLHGQRSGSLGSTNGDRIMSMNANGESHGSADEDTGFLAIVGHGQVTYKEGGSGDADHFNIEIGGEGKITAQE